MNSKRNALKNRIALTTVALTIGSCSVGMAQLADNNSKNTMNQLTTVAHLSKPLENQNNYLECCYWCNENRYERDKNYYCNTYINTACDVRKCDYLCDYYTETYRYINYTKCCQYCRD